MISAESPADRAAGVRAPYFRKWDKLWPDRPLDSYTDIFDSQHREGRGGGREVGLVYEWNLVT